MSTAVLRQERIPHLTPGTPLRIVAVVDAFSNQTLHDALGMVQDVSGTWNQGVDDATRLSTLTADLDHCLAILEDGDDRRVRAMATETLRGICAMFRRGHALGLVETQGHDATLLLSPDAYEQAL